MDIVLVGASGYGSYYLDLFQRFGKDGASVCSIVDPFAEKSRHFGWLKDHDIPIYPHLAAFYNEKGNADLVIISSPIQFHREQIIEAITHGSAVLCEKPVCALTAEALELRDLIREASRPLGVGFQWSFSKPILDAKQDILDGKYGAPVCLKSHVSWKRKNEYYEASNWKGRLYDTSGNCIMDSIAMNATAHYLHNILFMLGDRLETSDCPSSIEGALFRGRDIESYDTCFLRGEFKSGCEMIYCVSHVGENNTDPKFEYLFENGRITYDANKDSIVYGEFADGSVKSYGDPMTDRESFRKVEHMIRAASTGKRPVCDINTVLPHLIVCETMINAFPITTFADDRLEMEDNPPGVHVRELNAVMDAFYINGRLPGIPGFIDEGMMGSARIELSFLE